MRLIAPAPTSSVQLPGHPVSAVATARSITLIRCVPEPRGKIGGFRDPPYDLRSKRNKPQDGLSAAKPIGFEGTGHGEKLSGCGHSRRRHRAGGDARGDRCDGGGGASLRFWISMARVRLELRALPQIGADDARGRARPPAAL